MEESESLKDFVSSIVSKAGVYILPDAQNLVRRSNSVKNKGIKTQYFRKRGKEVIEE